MGPRGGITPLQVDAPGRLSDAQLVPVSDVALPAAAPRLGEDGIHGGKAQRRQRVVTMHDDHQGVAGDLDLGRWVTVTLGEATPLVIGHGP